MASGAIPPRTQGRGRTVLGINADFHDASAALVVDGKVVAAAEEERFTRVKHDASLPRHAIAWALAHAGAEGGDLDAVAIHGKPFTTYERVLSTHAKAGPAGLRALGRAVPAWTRSKLWLGQRVRRALAELGHVRVPITYVEHHLGHAASAFYPSPYESAAVLTFDAAGEWTTSSLGVGRGTDVRLLATQRFPDSLGLLYSAMTYHCGFEVNDGEYKLMGLAPFGAPKYVDVLLDRVIDLGTDGSIRLDQRWFAYQRGERMTSRRMAEVLDGPPRRPEDPISQREADIACSVQAILEQAVIATARHAHALTGERNVCLAGGVALNCVANAVLRDSGPFDGVWVQPAASDAGGALGAALWEHFTTASGDRAVQVPDAMAGARLGPGYTTTHIAALLDARRVPHRRVEDPHRLADEVADRLAKGAIVGWFQGRMEFGPRALGGRSILADPRSPAVIGRLNAMVKGRESFRPFAPSVLAEHAADWFDLDRPSPYMTFTAPVRDAATTSDPDTASSGFAARLARPRSAIAACTHVDGSARVQTVTADHHPELHLLLSRFDARTGCPVLLNTSFNRAGEPIVCSPADALRSAGAAGLDLLVLGDVIVEAAALSASGPEDRP